MGPEYSSPRPASPLGVDTHIQFFLATCDVNGNPSTGIVNDPTTQLAFGMQRVTQRDTIASYASLQSYPTTKYLNIFVYAMESGKGYCDPNSSLDAVVVVPGNFGSYPTTAHEVGHWLGLGPQDNDPYNFMFSAGLQGQTQDKICLFYDSQGNDVNSYLDNHSNTRNVHTTVPFTNRDNDTDADLGGSLGIVPLSVDFL